MILGISSEGFGIFEDFDVELSEGLNVITGESGTGKSMFLNLLRLLCGHDVKFPITASRAYVEMLIDDGSVEPEIVSVRWLKGRLNYRLNRESVKRSKVREFCEDLVEFHVQGVAQHLPRRFETEVLDAGLPDDLIEAYRKTYGEYTESLGLLKLHGSATEIDEEIASLSSEVERIEEIVERVGDERDFLEKVKAVENAEEIRQHLNELDALLDSITLENLQTASAIASRLKALGLRELDERLSTALEMVRDAIGLVRRYETSDEFDLANREAILALLDSLRWVKNRYGPTFNDVVHNLKAMKKRLSGLTAMRERISSAERMLPKLEERLEKLGGEIDERRRQIAEEIEEKALEVLDRLGMGNVELKFEFTPFDTFGPNGLSHVRLLIRTLSHAELEPFEKIASGGERSRIYLALHLVKPKTGVEGRKTLVFDELESGLGQRYADKLATLLKEVSKSRQLIVVTHLPQVAMAADIHFRVKREGDVATIKAVDGEERRMEIEAMFGKPGLEEYERG